jgi:hypothetical protein
VPDEETGEVGGLQNTITNLGASIGTALAGAVLISGLTSSFFAGISSNPNVPQSVVSQAQTKLAAGVPFMSDADLEKALQNANVPAETTNAIVDENSTARLNGLRASLSTLGIIALIAVLFGRGLPRQQPGSESAEVTAHDAEVRPRET